MKRGLGIPAGRKVIVYLGLLTEYQGIGLLLQAVQHLKARRSDFHLLLMGFPDAGYRERAAEMDLEDVVTFTGKVAYEEAPGYLAIGDVAVAPKISATEGSGKILNYMSMALPTVAFKTPVSREYLNDHGIYATEQTVAGLAEALNRVLDMSDLDREMLGQRLRAWVIEHYGWERAGRQLVEVYEALMDGERPLRHIVDPNTNQ